MQWVPDLIFSWLRRTYAWNPGDLLPICERATCSPPPDTILNSNWQYVTTNDGSCSQAGEPQVDLPFCTVLSQMDQWFFMLPMLQAFFFTFSYFLSYISSYRLAVIKGIMPLAYQLKRFVWAWSLMNDFFLLAVIAFELITFSAQTLSTRLLLSEESE